jgi:uncharacterized protein YjbI with pentapeptide repeats
MAATGAYLVPDSILQNPFYILSLQGMETWNRWAASGLNQNQLKLSGYRDVRPFSDKERDDLAAKIGLSTLPDPSAIDFSGMEFVTRQSFEGYLFPSASFYGCEFKDDASFHKATFLGCSFVKASFNKGARFTNTKFFCSPTFQESKFNDRTAFSNAHFHDHADFNNVKFERGAEFTGVTFEASAAFDQSQFNGHAYFDRITVKHDVDFQESVFKKSRFRNAKFESNVIFAKSKFVSDVTFKNTDFLGETSFQQTHFHENVKFSDAKFKDSIDFSYAIFREAPLFHETEIHADITFYKSQFLLGENFNHETADAIWDKRRSAWRVLRLAMNKAQSVEEELIFFALEMQARARLEHKMARWAIQLYGLIANYGISIRRPLCWLGCITVFFFFGFALLASDSECFVPSAFRMCEVRPIVIRLIAFTLISALPILGQSKLAERLASELFGDALTTYVLILSAVESLVSLALLFLIGLGIRNLFRLK